MKEQALTEQALTIHLTFTGPLAGQPFCDVNKAQALADGTARFAHVPYSQIETFLARPDICPKCLARWESAK
jgi:hypothetical protein